MAADLIEAGVDVHEIYRRVYEGVPYGKLALLARGLANVAALRRRPPDDHRPLRRRLLRLRRRGELLRGRHRPSARRPGHPRSRRSCAIASAVPTAAARCRCAPATTPSTCRRSPAPRAAAVTARPPASAPSSPTTSWCRFCASSSPRSLKGRLQWAAWAGLQTTSSSTTSPPASPRTTWWPRCGGRCRVRPRSGHAGTLDPFATGLLLVLVGRATRAQRFFMALPKRYEVVARFGAVSTTGDPEGEITETGQCAGRRARAADRARAPAAAGVLGGEGGGTAGVRAGARRDAPELAEREVEVYRFEQLWHDGDRRAFVIECSSGTYVRSLIADLGDAYCLELRRTRIGAFDVADADPRATGGAVRRPGVPARGAAGGGGGPAGRPRGARRAPAPAADAAGDVAAGAVRLTDADGLIALAEPRVPPRRARAQAESSGSGAGGERTGHRISAPRLD